MLLSAIVLLRVVYYYIHVCVWVCEYVVAVHLGTHVESQERLSFVDFCPLPSCCSFGVLTV